MSKPVFSVIMPAYNAQETIGAAIESVLNQTLAQFELIIIEDHSVDLTRKIIKEYSKRDSRIVVIENKKNAGVAYSRNRGLSEATGRYIAFLDADDLWVDVKLGQQYSYFKKGYDLIYSEYIRFSMDNETKVKVPVNGSYGTLLKGNYIGNLTGAYDRKALGVEYQKEIGHEDYLMWLKLMERSRKNIGVQEVLAKYRIREKSLSSNKLKSAKWTWHIYNKELGIGTIRSSWYFTNYVLQALIKRGFKYNS